MKTVIDAVIIFKGVWPYPFDNHITQLHEVGSFEVAIDDFNQCVDEMATNFGTSETYSDYKANYEMINDDMAPLIVKPVYTQAMTDAGTLPSVGMECSVYDINQDETHGKATIKYISDSTCVYEVKAGDLKGEYAQYPSSLKFKPLTPPIEPVEGKAYQFELSFGDIWIGYYGGKRNSFFSDILLSNKLCGKIEASNIQLLGVTS
jgi:hypothetical protein